MPSATLCSIIDFFGDGQIIHSQKFPVPKFADKGT